MEQTMRTLLEMSGKGIHSVSPDATVTEAVHCMNEARVGAVLVLDGDRLAGIFTERDVLQRIIDGHRDPDATPVREVMTPDVVVLRPDDTLQHAMVLVNSRNCRHLPVMDGDRVLGVVSVRDLIGAVVDGQEHRIAELTDYIYGGYGHQQVGP